VLRLPARCRMGEIADDTIRVLPSNTGCLLYQGKRIRTYNCCLGPIRIDLNH
jgi:hypothetical protein